MMHLKYKYIFVLLIPLLALSGCNKHPNVSAILDNCIAPFNVFAYEVPESPNSNDREFFEKSLPPDPWLVESDLPESSLGSFVEFTIEESRSYPNYVEIWVKRHTISNAYFEDKADDYQFLVYRTDTKDWRIVQSEVENSGLFVKSLYVLSDNSIWGSNAWDKDAKVTEQIVLSKFNEISQSFEFVYEVQDIPAIGIEPNGFRPWSEVVLDSTDRFWIFAPRDSIYSYNPDTNEIINHVKISDYYVTDAAVAQNGSIYIAPGGSSGFLIKRGDLLLFDSQIKEIVPVKLPLMPWPHFSSLLVDKSGGLWLDAIGRRSVSGEWHKLHDQTWNYLRKMMINHAWNWYIPPRVVLESSDGRIWFASELRDSDRGGIAWIDPNTYEGCWLTNFGNNIIEDQQHTLWIVADEKLYKHNLEP